MFSLISFEINARVDKFESAMQRTADIADASLSAAAANADQFQTAFDQAATAAGQSSQKMASDFEAANDRILGAAGKSSEAIDSINQAAEQVDAKSWTDKIATAIGAGFGAGLVVAQTGMEKVEEFVKTKLILIGAALAVGITVAAASAIYVATQIVSASIGFIEGLFTGESYQSENIDAVIALNQEVKALQEGLLLSADHASALNEALKGAGVGSSAYVSTLEAATKAAHSNTEELDRLGVQYKDTNGELLSQQDILKNAKEVLDTYSVGWDRNAAAAAIGMGSFQAISDAVSITRDKVEQAGQRLVDYNLIIGTGTQEAVTRLSGGSAGLQPRERPDGAGLQESHRRPDPADPHRPGGVLPRRLPVRRERLPLLDGHPGQPLLRPQGSGLRRLGSGHPVVQGDGRCRLARRRRHRQGGD
jgi:hypothetical protein